MVVWGRKLSLATQIFIAMILGSIAGLLFGDVMVQLAFIGDIWLNCIKMIVIPMVVCTIVTGIISQEQPGALKRVSARIIAYYVVTTIFACIVGLTVASVLQPGQYANFGGLAQQEITGGAANLTFAGFLKSLFSTNIFKSFTDGNIIQTLIISIFLGVAILKMKNDHNRPIMKNFFQASSEMIFSLIGMVMKASPIGVFFLMGNSFGKYGAGIFTSMDILVGTYYFACLCHILIVYGGFLGIFARLNIFKFIKNSAELWIYTISTCSSIAAIPVNIRVAKEKYNIPERISGFTVPLGSQMNTDGSVLLYGCVILFISQMIGQEMTLLQLVNVVFVSTIMSMGGGGIPRSGIVKLMIVVQAVGLPIEIVGVIAAFYHLFDMGTTTNNCLGDLVGTVVVGKAEERYEQTNAAA